MNDTTYSISLPAALDAGFAKIQDKRFVALNGQIILTRHIDGQELTNTFQSIYEPFWQDWRKSFFVGETTL